ncbi:DNA repair protein RadC [Candidatus Peregrinibacteria bacterium]|nr:DNA repair protein RadC [Candidatus Peregrinibacteria bacterium]
MLPREKLIKFGITSLENHELLALILGHGSRTENIFSISKRLLNDYGINPLLKIQNTAEITSIYKIGPTQAAKLIAAVELGRRIYKKSDNNLVKITNAGDVFDYIKPLGDFKREIIYGLYLNTRNILVHEEILAMGSLESSSIHTKDIFYPAITNNTYSIILVHNHPSEDPTPSEADICFTKEVEKASILLQIPFLDHIIIAKDRYYSFNENN